MAACAVDFVRAHPISDSGFTAAAARLEELVTRGDLLGQQEVESLALERAAVARRGVLRTAIRNGALSRLAEVASSMLADHPELGRTFVLPLRSGPHKIFHFQATKMLAAAELRNDLFTTAALGHGLLDHLAQAIARYEATSRAVSSAHETHVMARAGFAPLVVQSREEMQILDRCIRTAFSGNPVLIDRWKKIVSIEGSIPKCTSPSVWPATPVVAPDVAATGNAPAVPSAPHRPRAPKSL